MAAITQFPNHLSREQRLSDHTCEALGLRDRAMFGLFL